MVSHNGRTVCIAGGTRGIGRAVAVSLARHGYSRIIVNYNQDDVAAAETVSQVEQLGASCHAIRANLALPLAINELFDQVAHISPEIDAFVHCAALGAFKPLSEVKPNQWDVSMSINARSFVQCVQRCRSLMHQGAIVAISSLGGRMALPNYGAIGPSKAALEASVRQFAAELGPDGIRVNAIAGGFIETGSLISMPSYEEVKDYVARNTPLGRIGVPEDIADIVAFLLSPDAGWIQGQVIVADGGFSIGTASHGA